MLLRHNRELLIPLTTMTQSPRSIPVVQTPRSGSLQRSGTLTDITTDITSKMRGRWTLSALDLGYIVGFAISMYTPLRSVLGIIICNSDNKLLEMVPNTRHFIILYWGSSRQLSTSPQDKPTTQTLHAAYTSARSHPPPKPLNLYTERIDLRYA